MSTKGKHLHKVKYISACWGLGEDMGVKKRVREMLSGVTLGALAKGYLGPTKWLQWMLIPDALTSLAALRQA